jgi:hypothetical protein
VFHFNRHFWILPLWVTGFFLGNTFVFPSGPNTAQAQDSMSVLSEEVVALRQQVDGLSREVQNLRQTFADANRSHKVKLGELEFARARHEQKNKVLREKIDEVKSQIAAQDLAERERMVAVFDDLQTLRRLVDRSPPLKKAERLAQLDSLADAVNRKLTTAPQAYRGLVQFIEAETNLRGQVSAFRQSIEISAGSQFPQGKEPSPPGGAVPASVLAFGYVAAVYLTSSGDVGYLTQSSDTGDWHWKSAAPSEEHLIRNLMHKAEKGTPIASAAIPVMFGSQALDNDLSRSRPALDRPSEKEGQGFEGTH